MPKFLIEPADLPAANLQLITPISAGRGWLGLTQQAVEIAAGEPIASIKEKAGLLDVHMFTREAAKFPRLHELRQVSASICEICGEPGTLAYHQVRCEDHQGWRTSPPISARPARLYRGLRAGRGAACRPRIRRSCGRPEKYVERRS